MVGPKGFVVAWCCLLIGGLFAVAFGLQVDFGKEHLDACGLGFVICTLLTIVGGVVVVIE